MGRKKNDETYKTWRITRGKQTDNKRTRTTEAAHKADQIELSHTTWQTAETVLSDVISYHHVKNLPICPFVPFRSNLYVAERSKCLIIDLLNTTQSKLSYILVEYQYKT